MSAPSPQDVHAWALAHQVSPRRAVAVTGVAMDTDLSTVRTQVRCCPGLATARVIDYKLDIAGRGITCLLYTMSDICLETAPQVLNLPEPSAEDCRMIYADSPSPEEASTSTGLHPSQRVTSTPYRVDPPRVSFTPSGLGGTASWARSPLIPPNPDQRSGGITTMPSIGTGSRSQALSGNLDVNTIVSQLAEAVTISTQAQNYRKLKAFSGILPTPTGEEGIEAWRDHTLQIMEEWSCSEASKRQRLVECLRGPAARLVRAHRSVEGEVTAQELVEMLIKSFARKDDEDELLAQFKALRQREGQDLSAFVCDLQLSLGTLLDKHIISAAEADRYRFRQLLKGSLPDHNIAIMMRAAPIAAVSPKYGELMDYISAAPFP
ncbi:uncharacterized protein LOC142500024 [Ascaphus truei]|uniref:uncharacterized protein LOC142500024 n=1 Tax=Ascaphus truei TaxID=8439 RepID=UPI003F5A08B7